MKRMILAGATLLLMIVLCACGQKQVELDVPALAEELRALCGEEMFELDADTASTLYAGATAEEMVIWASGGVLADEVAVFRAADDAAAKELLEIALSRLEDQIAAFSAYAPEEASKLENAIAEQHGLYAVVCVTADTEGAREIIDNAVK